MQTDRGSLTKIYWHFFHVWWEACGARLLAASGEGLYQMEICSLIDTSCYKPHWQRRWQSGETWVEALHGTEQKKTKNYRNGNKNMKPTHYFGKKGNDSKPLDSWGFWQWASAGPPWKTPTSTVFSQSVNGRKRLQPKHWRPLQADRTNSLKRATYNPWILTSTLKNSNMYRFFFVVVVFGWPYKSASSNGKQAELQPGIGCGRSRKPLLAYEWLCQHGCCSGSYLQVLQLPPKVQRHASFGCLWLWIWIGVVPGANREHITVSNSTFSVLRKLEKKSGSTQKKKIEHGSFKLCMET